MIGMSILLFGVAINILIPVLVVSVDVLYIVAIAHLIRVDLLAGGN